jgi:hypothetical protein
MAAQRIDVGKINGNFYGGLPYSADWSFNNGSSPSTLKVSVVNSEGKYPNIDSDLTYTKTVTVTLGDFKFVGYLVSYEISQSPEQKLLTLNYVDQSVDLERYYVGLYNRHALAGNLKNLITVGKEYHPCDKELDSTKGYNDIGSSPIDPCDPCPYMPSDKFQSACDPIRSEFQIFEVYYTFNDLLDKLPLPKEGADKPNKAYKAQHTGTLKSVLDSWCSELGISYYWDPFKSKLVFLDRSKPVQIPSNLANEANIIEYTYGASKQNTFGRGFIGYLAKQGEYKKYKCTLDDTDSFQSLSVLTIGDLFNPDNYKNPNYLTGKELSCVMAKYGKPLRDAVLWFYTLGFRTAKDLNSYKYDSTSSSQSSNVITALGKMKILRVYHPTINDKYSGDFPALCRQVLNPTEYSAMQDKDKTANRDLTNPSWYFFIADCDDELAASQYEVEQKLGSDFLGKYWFKYYNTPIPGASNANTQISTEVPDGGNASWYKSNNDVSSLPIFGYGHEAGSAIDKLISLSKEDAKEGIKTKNKLTTTKSFLLADRPTKFIPTDDQIKDYDSLFKWYQEYTPAIIGGDGRPDILFDFYPEAKNNTNIKLFIAREYSGLRIKFENVSHPLESNSATQKTETHENSIGNQIVRNIGKYGLTSSQCVKITVGSSASDNDVKADMSKSDIVIYTPPNCFKYVGSASSYAGSYIVYANAYAEFPKILPKVQSAIGISPTSVDVAHLDYNFKEIQEENLDSLTNSKNCIPSEKQISAYISNLGTEMAYTMNTPQKTATIKLPGIVPKTWGIDQALNSIQINITENGSYTTYNFEDKIISKPDDGYIMQYLLDRSKPASTLGTSHTTSNDINNIKYGLA